MLKNEIKRKLCLLTLTLVGIVTFGRTMKTSSASVSNQKNEIEIENTLDTEAFENAYSSVISQNLENVPTFENLEEISNDQSSLINESISKKRSEGMTKYRNYTFQNNYLKELSQVLEDGQNASHVVSSLEEMYDWSF